MSVIKREDHLGDCLDDVCGALPYNLGRTIELIWNSMIPMDSETREGNLRRAAHYLGRELDLALEESKEEIEWDEVSEPKRNRLNEKPDPDSFL